MTPADLVSIRKYGEIVLSPDAALLAVEVQRRPERSGFNYSPYFGSRNSTDLWIIRRSTGRRQNLTELMPQHSTSWKPVWSPDGQRLAFFSTLGKEQAFLMVWDRRKGQIRRLSSSGVDLRAKVSVERQEYQAGPMRWLDQKHLLVILLSNGQRSLLFDENTQGLRAAISGVDAVRTGHGPTSISALSPAAKVDLPSLPIGRVTIVDVDSGRLTVVGQVPVVRTRTSARYVVVSPSHERAAVVADVGDSLEESGRLWYLHSRQFGLLSLSGDSRETYWLKDLFPNAGDEFDDRDPALSWNGDSAVVVVARRIGPASGGSAPTVTLDVLAVDVHAYTTKIIAVLNNADSVSEVCWSAGHGIAIRQQRGDEWVWHLLSDIGPANAWHMVDAPVQPSDPTPSIRTRKTVTGTLLEIDSVGRERVLFPSINPQLADVAPPQCTTFKYLDPKGESLTAVVQLPFDYKPGKRYPTVVNPYEGDCSALDDPLFLNQNMLTGHGYLVLNPSVPLGAYGTADWMMHLNDGVDPAIDRAIELGLVDPDRLMLTGISYGGYEVFALITQIHRYKSAVAMMGFSDLVSAYARFDLRYSRTEPEFAADASSQFIERGQGNMGEPPWVDPMRYVRNSPIFYADRVTTPLLIVAGDVDSNHGGEEFYTALKRLGKPALYVNYLGEGHALVSRPNIVDFWQRIYAWFDECLKN